MVVKLVVTLVISTVSFDEIDLLELWVFGCFDFVMMRCSFCSVEVLLLAVLIISSLPPYCLWLCYLFVSRCRLHYA